MNVITKLHQAPSPALRLLVAGFLLVLAFAGGFAVADYKTVTLSVDGTAMTVTTMKSRVIDIIKENGFTVSERDDLYPAAGERVPSDANIVLRRSRPLEISLDGQNSKQVWTTASTVDEALAQLSMTDTAPAAASRGSRVPLAGMALPVVSAKTVELDDAGVVRNVHLAAARVGDLLAGVERAVGTERPGHPRRGSAGDRRHAHPGDPQPDREDHRASATGSGPAPDRGPADEHQQRDRRGRRAPRAPRT